MSGEPLPGSGPSTPESLGPYRVQGLLGSGGMGVVYLGVHRETNERVALKTVRLMSEPLLDSIRLEVRALGLIRHPGVVRILDHGDSNGVPWYAMELLEGRTLLQCIEEYQATRKRGRLEGTPAPVELSTHPLLKLVRGLCAPLAYLHGAGLVHRDLKPGNVFLRGDGTVVIGDFGLAAAFAGSYGRELLLVDEGRVGTLLYMAPEQILGDLVDARADLYSLGCVLYECVTGFPPFVGSHATLRHAHVQERPIPPSELLREPLPERLEWLILKLLEKQPKDRLGYAEDVDRVLAELGVEVVRPETLPRPRSYLYRPPFSGREEAVSPIRERLDELARSHGGRIFIGGGSGVGKTRLAMEMSREAFARELSVVTGECIPLSLSGERVAAGMRASPLHPFRPLLARVADRCRRQGVVETRRLLGPRGKVLVTYEPSLESLPGQRELPPPPPLANNAAELQRIFTSLQEVLFAFCEGYPLLLVLDDLQWADELTLGFLGQLRQEELAHRGVLLLGTYRMEEMSEPLRQVVSAPDALHLELGHLDASNIQSMIRGMLALSSLPRDFEGVVRQSGGNPFFVAEYLRAAIGEGLLRRDATGQWRLDERARVSLEALALPESIVAIIRRRLRGLHPNAQLMVELAAVFGREFDAPLLLRTAPLSQAQAEEALDTLWVHQILEKAVGGRLRFIHDKLREFSYAGLPAGRRRELHHRVAQALEQRYSGTRDFALLLPNLANHWAQAEVHDRASHYFGLAGDQARTAYANGEAISFYRSALAEVELHLQSGGSAPEGGWPALRHLHESLGDVLALTGEQETARAAYAEALARLSPFHRLHRACLLRKVGKTWETRHQHEAALRAYEEAEAALGPAPSERGENVPAEEVSRWWQEWLQLQSDRIWVNYWADQLEAMGAIIEKVRPYVEARGTPLQRVHLFESFILRSVRRDRYVISAETLEYARKAVAASEESGEVAERAMSQFFLSFCLLFHGDLDEAEQQGVLGLRLAERVGDLTLQARILSYLMQVHRRRDEVSETRAWAERSLRLATEARMDDYVGAALATRAWVAWKEQRLEEAERDALAALECWRKLSELYPFAGQWQGLLLLLELDSRRGDVASAVERARAVLDPLQQRLPEPLARALEAGLAAWDQGQHQAAGEHLRRAVGVARELHFL